MMIQHFFPLRYYQNLNYEIDNSQELNDNLMKLNPNKLFSAIEHLTPIIDTRKPLFKEFQRSRYITPISPLKNNLIENDVKNEFENDIFIIKKEKIKDKKKLNKNKDKPIKPLKKTLKKRKSNIKGNHLNQKKLIKLSKLTFNQEEISINIEVPEKEKPQVIDFEIQLDDMEIQNANKEGLLLIPPLESKNKCNFCGAILKNKRSLGGHISRNHRKTNESFKNDDEKRFNIYKKKSQTRHLLAKIQYYKKYENIDFLLDRYSNNFKGKKILNKAQKKAFLEIKKGITEDMINKFLGEKESKIK